MKFYFLTDESEKSLAPFFSQRVLETLMAGVAIVGAFLIVFWSRRPISELIATGNEPIIFFLIFAATLIVNSYINLCCGGGEMVRKGYHIINYQTDKPTYEMDIDFYRYGLVEFLLHTLLLLLPFLPLLFLAAFSPAVSMITFIVAVCVLYTTSLFCRMSGFLVYLSLGRSSTLGYFAARALMIFFVFATIYLAPAINPLQILYLLNKSPNSSGYSFAIYMAVALFVILILILVNNALVRRHINESSRSGLRGSGFKG
jgi:hypothetical protein